MRQGHAGETEETLSVFVRDCAECGVSCDTLLRRASWPQPARATTLEHIQATACSMIRKITRSVDYGHVGAHDF